MSLKIASPETMNKAAPNAPKGMQKFAARMHEAGFHLRDTRSIQFQTSQEYEKLSNGELKRMNFFYRWGYKVKSLFKDELSGLRYPKDYYVFNRNLNGEKSNFIVFAEYGWHFRNFLPSKGLRVMFSNPLGPDQKGEVSAPVLGYHDRGLTGKELKKEQVLLNLDLGRCSSKGYEANCDRLIGLIKQISAYKADNEYYFSSHSHAGYTRGRLAMDAMLDDGRAHEKPIAMNMALAHTDGVSVTMHNHHFRPFFMDFSAIAAAVGMVAIPGMEVTMPIHLYDNYSVERFVEVLNEKRERVNEIVESVNSRRAAISQEISELQKGIDALAARINGYEKAIFDLDYEISSLKGKRKNYKAYDLSKRYLDEQLSLKADELDVKKNKRVYQKYKIKGLKNRMFELIRELNELGPQDLERIEGEVPLPRRFNGRYDAGSVNAMLDRYGVTARMYNSTNGNALAPIPLPESEHNGPHVTMYAGSEELMNGIMQKYLAHRNVIYPPLAGSKIEMRRFIMDMNAENWNGVAFGMAHPACSKSLPAVDILRRISLGDINIEEAEELMCTEVHLAGAFNDTIADKEAILFIPWGKEKLEQVRAEAIAKYGSKAGTEIYEDEVRRARDIAEARNYFAKLMFEMDKKHGLGVCTKLNEGELSPEELADSHNVIYEHEGAKYRIRQTLNAVNLAWSYHLAEAFNIGRAYDADTHFYVDVKIGRKYIGPTLYGRTAIRMPGGAHLFMNPGAFVSAIHRAKEIGDVKADADLYWTSENGVPQIAPERKHNTLWENALETLSSIRVYGIAGIPYLAKDVWRLLWHEGLSARSLQERFHYVQSMAQGGSNNKPT
ncbi:Uncharacterised protein [uncultured archaeon]|nr:Uncharacterised protein [uncultured archaeon]